MGPLDELLATTHTQALEFFFLGLKDVCESEVDRQELLYNASVLAHYSQVSTQTTVEMPAPASLTAVFDHFVCDDTLRRDSHARDAVAQCLLLAGFFEGQMRRRHSIRCTGPGAAFYGRAAVQEKSVSKAQLLDTIGRHFEPWRQRHARLGRELRDQPYLIPPVS